MTEAVTQIDLAQYEALTDKKVKLTFVQGDDSENIEGEGVLLAVSAERGVMFRKRGSQSPMLIPSADLRNIELLAEPPKKVTAKKLKAVTLDDARNHLADRHGYTLKVVNDATAEQAMLAHSQLDHSDLGHTHDDGTKSPASETEATVAE